jgi:predicted AAA+ superfamily ATPase
MTATPPLSGLVPRRALPVALARLQDEPVVALQGPRSVGKSTLLAQIATSVGAEVIDLDDLALRDAVGTDPGSFVGSTRPVCIDEYQHVPEVLDAIKAELNRDMRAGRFVLTGSTRHDALPRAAQSLTGRLHVLAVWPLSQGELAGTHENLLEVLLNEPTAVPTGGSSTVGKQEYIERVVGGGMPMALARAGAARQRWFDDYVRLVVERDVRDLARLRQWDQMPALLRRLAGQTAQVLNVTTAAAGLGIDRTTAADYVKLLEAVFLVVRLEAWGTTLRSRAAGSPKIHLVDTGIAARLLRLTPEKLSRKDPTSLTEFGHLLETFVVVELLKQASWLDDVAGCGHWRTRDGDEVDLVVERGDGGIVAIEVKAAGRVPTEDLRHLRKLRDAVGDGFLAGAVLYTGPRAYRADDRLWVLPIERLWQPI